MVLDSRLTSLLRGMDLRHCYLEQAVMEEAEVVVKVVMGVEVGVVLQKVGV